MTEVITMDKQVLRIGKISSINYKNGTARVTYEDRENATTKELPFLAWTYWMPEIGQKVLVGHLSNGTTSAVILGPLWCDGHRPGEYGADLYLQEMSHTSGQAVDEYSDETGIRLIKAKHLEFASTADNIDITLAAIVSRISSLESRIGG